MWPWLRPPASGLAAFELLLDEINRTEGEDRKRLLELTVALFAGLAHEHPVTMRYRRRLAAAFYWRGAVGDPSIGSLVAFAGRC